MWASKKNPALNKYVTCHYHIFRYLLPVLKLPFPVIPRACSSSMTGFIPHGPPQFFILMLEPGQQPQLRPLSALSPPLPLALQLLHPRDPLPAALFLLRLEPPPVDLLFSELLRLGWLLLLLVYRELLSSKHRPVKGLRLMGKKGFVWTTEKSDSIFYFVTSLTPECFYCCWAACSASSPWVPCCCSCCCRRSRRYKRRWWSLEESSRTPWGTLCNCGPAKRGRSRWWCR